MADKETPNVFVSVQDAALVMSGLDLVEASLKRRITAERNAQIKQLLADQAFSVSDVRKKFGLVK